MGKSFWDIYKPSEKKPKQNNKLFDMDAPEIKDDSAEVSAEYLTKADAEKMFSDMLEKLKDIGNIEKKSENQLDDSNGSENQLDDSNGKE